ncbi:dehydratase [Steroidobacter denitrificans]|uniref:Dehydratase n=1 Tax=Steroidobacter denitrificans TaxID=465721 RepID=A0A127F711_STEDE|nr:nuclear transport factor 2 family protein [Steroidobacter denitrificans]AMN46242.1 dehydratase [Steroidobacter denitrificans]
MDLQALSDKLEIQEALARYARAVDDKDWALWKTVFTPDAHIDYRSAGGSVGGRDEIANWLRDSLEHFSMTQHYITNIEIELDGDEARVIALFYNPMIYPGATGLSYCGGRYHHRFVRTPEGWKSRNLREENQWFVKAPGDAKEQ